MKDKDSKLLEKKYDVEDEEASNIAKQEEF